MVNVVYVVFCRYRTFDGTCNNLGDPLRGATNTKMDRMLRALYRDGEGEPYGSSAFNYRADEDVHEAEDRRGWYWGGNSRGCDKTYPNQLPEPRLISRTFHRDSDMPDREIALMLMQFGQFVDHDITLTPEAHVEVDCCEATEEVVENQDCLSIALPPGDPFGTNFNLTCLEFRRSTAFCPECEDVREQFDIISQYVDTSNIYGSDPTFSCQLRSATGGFLLSEETDDGSEYLPKLGSPPRLTSGDIRALEMPGLASMHTLWLREHNGIAQTIRDNTEGLTNEEIFQETRRIVIAQYQNIVYSEFLKAVLGYAELCNFNLDIDGLNTRYDSRERGVILNEFATAAYRFGHTLIQGTVIPREPSNKSPLTGYRLRDVFFNENQVKYHIILYHFYQVLSLLEDFFHFVQLDESMSNGGVDRLLTGIAEQEAQKFDQFITEEVSNFLLFDFGSPRSDLIARNLQRSRDHGLRG